MYYTILGVSLLLLAATTINSEGEQQVQTLNKSGDVASPDITQGEGGVGGHQVGGPAVGKHPMDTVMFTKCTYKWATCGISCLLCRCGGTERLNKMVAACKLMWRAGGGCIGHSQRILESGAHNLLHSTTQTSTKGQRSCINGPRRSTVGPGRLVRVRAQIDRVARKKLYKKKWKGSFMSGNTLPLLRVLSQSGTSRRRRRWGSTRMAVL